MSYLTDFFRREASAWEVPPLQTYYTQYSNMTGEQQRFYRALKAGYQKGKFLNVDGNLSYVFCYCYEVQASEDLRFVYDQLTALAQAYASERLIPVYCRFWAIDALIGLGQLERAISEFPILDLSRSGSLQTALLLSLKLRIGGKILGRDILTLNGPTVTAYAKEHLDQIAQFLDVILSESDRTEGSVLKKWKKTFSLWRGPHHMFNGSPSGRKTDKLEVFGFSRCRELIAHSKELTREAENTFREERGVPRIGEGWISETELFYQIKRAFPHFKVIHHGRPKWLGRQHLDIYIEDADVAIEYQGEQHFSAQAYFGGEEGFKATQRRDKRKQQACKANGIALIYVTAGYLLPAVIAQIGDSIGAKRNV
jgi:hypothetical protein